MYEEYFKVLLSGAIRVALPLSAVETVCKINQRQVCPIPGVQPSLLGVFNRQGTLTWVWDITEYMGLGSQLYKPGKDWTAVVITRKDPGRKERQQKKISAACVVAQLEGVFAPSEIKAFTKPVKPKLQPLFAGVAYSDKQKIAVLNPSALLEALYSEQDENKSK
ncbi:MAG: chemotaxis protein CheW [Hormoscilla sp.]